MTTVYQGAPVIDAKGLNVNYEVPNCSGTINTEALISASFDNVYVNQ